MARTDTKRTGNLGGTRSIGPRTRFAPDLLALEDRSVPAQIFVDPNFTGTAGGSPNQPFNAGGTGPLGSTPAAGLTFVAAGNSGGVTGTGSFATADVTTAFNAARDNPGDDTILLAPGTFNLDNSQGGSLTATYFFNGGAGGGNLSLLGSGVGASVLRPTATTADVDTSTGDLGEFDPVLAIRQGATFTARDFTFDAGGVAVGAAVGASSGSKLAVTRVAFQNIVFNDGLTNGGTTRGRGITTLDNGGTTGDQITVRDSTFANIAREAVAFDNSTGQVLGGTFTGTGAGTRVQYGVYAQGTSQVYVSGATFSGFSGVATDGSESAGLNAAEGVNGGGATLLAFGNTITGNQIGAAVAPATGGNTPDGTSVIVANFNSLGGNARGLDGTSAVASGTTGTDSGIDGRFNFFGAASGPLRAATNPVNGQPNNTGASGDEQLNPAGTGSAAVGNVRIAGFRQTAVPTTLVENPAFVADPTDTAGATTTGRAAFVGAGTPLFIFVNGSAAGFADANSDGKPDQAFNAAGTGPLGTVPAGSLTFVPAGSTFGVGGVTAASVAGTGGKIAVPDLTTAFNLARDNPGADVISLAASGTPFLLDNSQGASDQFGGFNPNTYFFNDSPLTILGSGLAQSVIRPTAATFSPGLAFSEFDPVFSVRNGLATFVGNDFTLDGSAAKIGTGIAASGGTSVTLLRVALREFVSVDGVGAGGASRGVGLFVNNAPGTVGQVTIVDSQFSGNGRAGVQTSNSNVQVFRSSFTGRGAGDRVDYGVLADGSGQVYVTGSRFTGFQGQASSDLTESAGIAVSQGTDDFGNPAPGGATLLAVGNKITGNRVGVAVANVSPTGASAADVRFNDLSLNLRSLDAAGGTGGTITAANNFFGDPAGPTGANGSPVSGGVTVTNIRPVTAPTIDVASNFGTSTAPALAAAGAATSLLYRTDPRVQSPATITGPATLPATGDVVFTVQFADRLVNQDSTLFSATFTPNSGGAAQTFTSSQLVISGATNSGSGSQITVTVPAALFTSNPSGIVTLNLAPSSGTAQDGNLQLTQNGFQTSGDTEDVAFGVVNSGPIISPNPGPTVVLTPQAPTQTVSFTVTFPAGVVNASVTNVTATSNNGSVTVTRVAGSPNTAPQFTVTSTSNAPGTAIVTVTASDNDPTSPDASTAFGVQFGVANNGPTLTVTSPANGSVQVPLGGTGTITLAAAPSGGRTIVSTVLDPSANNFAGVTVTQTGSPTNPTFTLTGNTNNPGSGTLTFITTDSDGLTDRATVFVQLGVTGTGVTIAPIGGLQFATNGPAQTASTTVSFPNGSGSVEFTSSNPGLFTVTQGGTSTSPTFTITPRAGQTGSGVVTVIARDVGGATSQTSFGVQVGNTVTSNISGVPTTTQVIPFNRSQDFPVSVTGVGNVTLTAVSSNPGVATVTILGTGQNRTVRVTANPTLTTGGVATITLNSVDANNQQSSASFTVQVAPQRVRRFAAGVGPGESPVVQVYGVNGERLFGFTAFELSFTGGVSVATGDVNGDGVDDIVAGASIGGGPRVRVIDGVDGNEIANFFAFEESFRNGVTVAVAKLIDTGTTADGFFREQIVVGAGNGGAPRVSSFDVLPGKGATPTRINNFFAFEDTFRNGVTVAAGDLTGDGIAEIVTGAGESGGPRVRSFNAAGSPAGVDFFAFDSAFRGGVNVAVGQLDGTGRGSIITGVGPNGGSLVRVFGPTGTQTTQFTAYPEAGMGNVPVRVGAAQFNPSGPESIVTGPGVGGGPLLRVFGGTNPGAGAVFSDFSFEQPFRGGIFVG